MFELLANTADLGLGSEAYRLSCPDQVGPRWCASTLVLRQDCPSG